MEDSNITKAVAAPFPDEKLEKREKDFPLEGTSIDEEKAIPAYISTIDGSQNEDDPNIVGWDGPDDPDMAMNWPGRKKWTMTFLLSILTLLTYGTKWILPSYDIWLTKHLAPWLPPCSRLASKLS